MAIKIGQEFERTSKATRFKDDVLTKSQMLSGTDDNYSDGYLVVEKDSHDLYIYNSSATPSAETGKFVKSSGSGGGGETPNIDQVLGQGNQVDNKTLEFNNAVGNNQFKSQFNAQAYQYQRTNTDENLKSVGSVNSMEINFLTLDLQNNPKDQFNFDMSDYTTSKPKVTMSTDVKQAWVDALDMGGGGYVLPTASATTLGGIKVGSNLTINGSGVLSADQVVEFNSNTDYGYGDIARACRRNIVYVSDGTDKRKPVVFFELDDNNRYATLYTAEKTGFSAYKWNSTEYVGKTSLTTIPNGGTTGQVLAKKSDTDQDFDWETIVSDGWGVAKAGNVTLTSTSGSHIPFQIIDITDLNLSSTDDYEILVTAEAQRSTAYKVDNVFANKISETQFEIGFYTPSQDGLTINLSYVVVAKGFQSIMGGGGGGDVPENIVTARATLGAGNVDIYSMTGTSNEYTPVDDKVTMDLRVIQGGTYGDLPQLNISTAGAGNPIYNKHLATTDYVDTEVAKKQNTLVSGTNIKTVNNQSLLGSGDIPIPTIVGSDWGVAKTGSGAVPAASGSKVYNSTSVDISDLGFTSANDYQVVICSALDQQSQNASTDVSVIGKSATSFTVKALATNANMTLSFAVPFLYTIFAKGYGSVPNGGTTGQALVKKSDTDGDVEWKTVSGGGASLTIDTTQVGYGEATVSEGGYNLSFTNQNGQGVRIGGISEDGEFVTSKGYVDSKSPTIVNEGATFTNAQGNQKMQIRTGSTNSVIIKDTNGNGTTEYWSYELPDKDYVDTEVAKKGNANTTFDNEYKTLQIRDVNDSVEFQVVKETSNDYVRVNEYAKDDRGQMQQIFDVNLPTKTYVDNQLATKQNTLTAGNGIQINNNIISSQGIDMKIDAEKWYGTYTDENNVTYQVYTKTIYIPALPATAGITTYQHGISGIKQILSAYGFTTDGFVLNAPRQNNQDNIAIYQVQKSATGGIAIEVGKDRSSKSAYVTLIYAKNN